MKHNIKWGANINISPDKDRNNINLILDNSLFTKPLNIAPINPPIASAVKKCHKVQLKFLQTFDYYRATINYKRLEKN